ncbi:MAG TPA: toxin-antitoxin system HicB family antitoxin, partial [Solirubrobacteraceae bacterium]
EVRVSGGDLEFVCVDDQGAAPVAEPPDEAYGARITLRLPESLKTRLETAATASGVSVNTWLVRALRRSLDARPSTRGSHRLTGYGRT